MTLKERARAYFSAVNDYDVATIERMLDENYIQHNPFVPTGRAAFLSFIPHLQKCGSKIRNRRMLEDGNHVVMHHQWENATPFGHDKMAAFHIIRFDDRSLIAEHWNVMRKDTDGGSSLTDGPTEIENLAKTNENKARVLQWLTNLTDRKPHAIFGEGNFALAISEGASTAIYDLFRFEKESIANHWQIAQEIPTKNVANHNTMFGFKGVR